MYQNSFMHKSLLQLLLDTQRYIMNLHSNPELYKKGMEMLSIIYLLIAQNIPEESKFDSQLRKINTKVNKIKNTIKNIENSNNLDLFSDFLL